jgi:hypothetical protein
MKSDWLAAASFERTHEVVSAINTLSIHAKLALAGVADPTPSTEIEQARRRLLEFLGRLEAVLKEAEQDEDGTIVGTDPRLGDLALQLLGGPARGDRRPPPSALPLAAVAPLVQSDRPDDLRRVVPYLQELRTRIEEQMHADVAGILGER